MPVDSYPSPESYPSPFSYPGVNEDDAQAFSTILRRMRARIPQDLANSFYGSEVLRTQAREIHRLHLALERLRDWLFLALVDPQALAFWEGLLKLPVDPPDATVQERRARASEKLRSRFDFPGFKLRQGIEAIGGPIVEMGIVNVEGQVTIVLGQAASQYAINQVEAYLYESGPAHIQWIIVSPNGANAFIVGSSTAGTLV